MNLDRIELPPYAHAVRGLKPGLHPFLALLPSALESPAMKRIANARHRADELVAKAEVQIRDERGFCWIDVSRPCIVIAKDYYETGSALDVYLDLLHEITHIRQHHEGHDLWDPRYAYHRRPTEIEGYAVAIEEGRRLGMTEEEVVTHLSNPWMSAQDVTELLEAIDQLLG